MPMQQQQMPVPGTQDGNWIWDGTQWVCGTCDGGGGFPFCPPPGFPPAGCPPWFSGMNSPPWYPGANAGVSFGTTAPLNPVRGHFWWNGISLALFDGAVWVDTSTGAIVPPNGSSGGSVAPLQQTQVTFAISAPTDFALSATPGSYAIVAFTATPQVDTESAWDPVTHKYRPTKPGLYQFYLRSWTSTQAGFSIAKNDPGTYSNLPTSDIAVAVGSQAAAGFMSINGIAQMNGTTDFVRCFGWNADAAFHNLGSNPVFSAVRLP
jgi:hypothetical protein